MKKSFFLTIIYVLFVKIWSINAVSFISDDIFIAIILICLAFSCIIYKPSINHRFGEKYQKYLYWIIIGWLGSMIMAYLFHGQSFFQSILTYKTQYLMLSILFIMKIAPTEREIITSLKYYTVIFALVYVVRLAFPSLFYITSDFHFDDGVSIPGYELICILLYYYLNQIKHRFNISDCVKAFLIIVLIFCQQNRSSLFPVILLSGWTFLNLKSRYKPIIIACITLIIIIAAIKTSEIWSGLIDQTQRELSDDDYNRNKALMYFIMNASPNIWCDIFGNGFLSAHTSSQMAKLMQNGIYNSDMGFIGYWNQFGLIPIIVFCYMFINAIFSKRIPYYIKLFAIQSLICAATTSYYGQSEKIICFVIFYYLYSYYTVSYQSPLSHSIKYINRNKFSFTPI